MCQAREFPQLLSWRAYNLAGEHRLLQMKTSAAVAPEPFWKSTHFSGDTFT